MNKPLLDDAGRSPGVALPRLHRGRELWAGVHIAVTGVEIDLVLKHRYSVYREERGPDYPGLNHETETLRDPEDVNSILLYSCDQTGAITASMRIIMQAYDELNDPDQQAFARRTPLRASRNYAAQLARMCTSDNRRASPQLLRMMLFAYFFGINNGVQIAFLHSRVLYKPLYERLGYCAIGPDQDGLLPMGIDLRDWRALQDARSPYRSVLSLREASTLSQRKQW